MKSSIKDKEEKTLRKIQRYLKEKKFELKRDKIKKFEKKKERGI
jgi:predicted nucleotidyltransferase